ncbi:hypothetical protein F5Y16DRAFT_425242 [Xylariaceae sp. FL0255]|nr:hypothetical protein F5Y16DRAFT_425242 [Xylariaceae sp. FL0255]
MDASFASDEVTSAMGHIFKTRTIPIWTVFAAQVLLDIQDMLKPVGDRALKEVKSHTRNMLSSFKSRKLELKHFLVDKERTKWISDVLHAYELDVLGDNFRKTAFRLGMASSGGIAGGRLDQISRDPRVPAFIREPDWFLKQNPVKFGMLKYGIYLQSHVFGSGLDGGFGFMSLIHLYIACRSLYPDDPVWPDMEYFLHFQDIETLFFGGLPESMEEAFKKLLLSISLTPSHFARDRRQVRSNGVQGVERGTMPSPKINLAKSRPVADPCVFDQVFGAWMSGGQYMNDDKILDLVNTLADPKTFREKARQQWMNPKTTAQMFSLSSDPNVHMVGLLKNLSFVVMSEMGNLYFDWISFAETCNRIWDQIVNFATDYYNLSGRVIPWGITLQILDEGRQFQWLAEELKQGVNSFVRENAYGLSKTWEIIQTINKKGLKVSLGKYDNSQNEGVKSWVGDKELFRVISKTLGESFAYPIFDEKSVAQVYKNWNEEDMKQCAVVRLASNRVPANRRG